MKSLRVSLALVVSSIALAHPPLTLDERVAWHLKLETVLDGHRTVAGGARRGPRGPVSMVALRADVERDLRRSAALESHWSWPIKQDDLQTEMDRMARQTRDPQLLSEMFDALGGDPYLIAECVARPALARRRFADRYGHDASIHAASPEDWLDALVLAPGWESPAIDGSHLRAVRIGTAGCGCGFANVAPEAREWSSAVWTGAEMIVWGGMAAIAFENGARYEPVTDSWIPLSTGSGTPSGRGGHTAVWTGTEMIVWGGGYGPWYGSNFSTGGRYDPLADSWRPTSTANAPSPRFGHTAIWTGSEMIVWGGRNGNVYWNGGGRYDPIADTWSATRLDASTPPAVYDHTAVWTGVEMIVWGGFDGGTTVDTGGRYDPATDTWQRTTRTAAPRPMSRHTAVWSGSEMILWGEHSGRYDPALDSWRDVYQLNAPSPNSGQVAFWTGTEMLVWGGDSFQGPGVGGLYDPVLDRWRTVSQGANAPASRTDCAAVFTGTEMLVWSGGQQLGFAFDDGARLDVASNSWAPMSSGGAVPSGRTDFSMDWTGAELIVFGGSEVLGPALDTGAAYSLATDSWAPTTTSPHARVGHVSAWTGGELIVWGGYGPSGAEQTGDRWDPLTDSWTPVVIDGATPSARVLPKGVWTGSALIIWGGYDGTSARGDGGIYDPLTDSWRSMNGVGAPGARMRHAAFWTGSEMIVWGGDDGGYTTFGDGGRYDPVTDGWSPVTMAGAPQGRSDFPAVWTGTELVVWGNYDASGGRYDPATDSWRSNTVVGAPLPRYHDLATWTGSEMVVWGGYVGGYYDASGGRYDPVADRWRATTTDGAPSRRSDARAVWTGSEVIVWGGTNGGGSYDSHPRIGSFYDPAGDRWWKGPDPPGVAVLCGKGAGGSPAHDTRVVGVTFDGRPIASLEAFPSFGGAGVRVGAGDVDGNGQAEVLAGPGPGTLNPPRVRGFGRLGTPVAGLDFLAYGASGFGANVAAGVIDGSARVLTGPGPSAAYGPQVRGFRYSAGAVTDMGKVNFYAYGTLRYGVNVEARDTDGDGFDEIVTGAGPGGVFGPHVRAFDFDGAILTPIQKVSFFAYATPSYGVNVGAGDIDGDGFGELLAGPGPSAVFGPQLRGFDVDGAIASAIGNVNAFVFAGAGYGLRVAGGDIDGDGFSEIAAGAGPDPLFGSELHVLDFDATSLRDIACLGRDLFGVTHGLDVAVGEVGY